jgi:TFIIF-interacting CTD phosphatase-like protein
VAQPIMNNLDTQGRAPHRLFKEHLSWGNGVYWKNLKLMNRDLSRLILIEDNKEAFAFNRDNTILIPSWNKDQTDNQLVKLVPFLVSLSQNDVKDVRETLRFYGNENTADNWIAEKKEKRKNSEQKRSSGGFLGSVRKPSLPSKKD